MKLQAQSISNSIINIDCMLGFNYELTSENIHRESNQETMGGSLDNHFWKAT